MSNTSLMTFQGKQLSVCRLKDHGTPAEINRLPFTLRVLLENLIRFKDGQTVTDQDIQALMSWDPKASPSYEIAFRPARVILQDFTGVPAVVDLAAMRDAMAALGGDIKRINPLTPVELVIDHSVMVDHFGSKNSMRQNIEVEYERNKERYTFMRWGQQAFENFKVVPPGTGIVHQVNLEHLARVVFNDQGIAYPDTVVGTDSHTTMINGLGVLGWGVGGIEAEAAMLGQPISMLIPQVVGFRLKGQMPEGTTATDLVLIIVERLRREGVVGKFVEFFGEGLASLPLADRATIANMAPEYGATCGFFPVDSETLNFLRLTGREEQHIEMIEAYCKENNLFHSSDTVEPNYSSVVELDLSTVVASIAGPKRPQDRIALTDAYGSFEKALLACDKPHSGMRTTINKKDVEVPQGAVLIAAITSCTNTSNPAVMMAAGLLAKKAVKLGLSTKAWVKTSLAPGSQVVTDYLNKADLMSSLEKLGFNVVGYGCTTCIGNSGPLIDGVESLVKDGRLLSTAVLSGNRNFEGRIHPLVQNAYLASPPLVVAYAIAGTMNLDIINDSMGTGHDGKEIYLKDIWPTGKEIQAEIAKVLTSDMFKTRYASVFEGDEHWKGIGSSSTPQCEWDNTSTYVKNPPYFEGMTAKPAPLTAIKDAHLLALLGDSVTTDHISPAGAIQADSPAGKYLSEHGVPFKEFNSYGSRRGNHEIMMRGTFANIRLRNQLAPGTEGGWTTHMTTGNVMSIFEAAELYKKEKRQLVIIAGKEYGTGSSRDWAAKGTNLLGVKAVITESYERIHRSNLIGMGVLPLQFLDGQSAKTLGIKGNETFDISFETLKPQGAVEVLARKPNGETFTFMVSVRIDTPKEMNYFEHGGILHYVLREMV